MLLLSSYIFYGVWNPPLVILLWISTFVDWTTGKTMYETDWENKGSVSVADGLMYVYEERRGNLALVRPTPEKFDVISSFRITLGSGPHWTQPVIKNGVLYIRHGEALMAYKVK